VTEETGGAGGGGTSSGGSSGSGGGIGGDECVFKGFDRESDQALTDAELGGFPGDYEYTAWGTRPDDGKEAFLSVVLPGTVDGPDWSVPQTVGFPGRWIGPNERASCPCVLLGLFDEVLDTTQKYAYYVAFAGSMEITASGVPGDHFTGGIRTAPMKFGKGNYDSMERQWGGMEPDGDVWCLDSYEFDAILEEAAL
jgi:hypothetical protein